MLARRLGWMVVALGVCWSMANSANGQRIDRRPTANWGTMPNGWVDHSGLNRHRTSFGNNFGRNPAVPGGWIGGYPIFINPGFVNPGFVNPGFVNPGFGYAPFPGLPPHLWGHRCVHCFNPHCFDPFCRGVVVGGLSLTVVAPQIVAVPPAGVVVAGAPFDNRADFGLAGGRSSGLPWLDRLRQQQAAAFDGQQAAFAAGRDQGWDANAQTPPRAEVRQRAEVDGDSSALVRRKVAELKLSNQTGRDRSDQLIAEADTFFSEQQMPKAAQRYRQAIAAAPNYPKALFRAGHYFMTTADYENSLMAYLMALEIAKDVRQPGFRLDNLYRGNALDKMTHMERLAEASLKRPDDGGLLMLVGLTLFYDQQTERSLEFFRNAAELEGPQAVYATWFVRSLER